jgi:hypothetical protein
MGRLLLPQVLPLNLTNYIHSTDSAAETNLHLLLAYPHLSLLIGGIIHIQIYDKK